MRYFTNRTEAGQMLAQKLTGNKNKNCSVISLSPSSTPVAMQIAIELHANLLILFSGEIDLPGEPDPVAAVTEDNTMTFNSLYSLGQLEEFSMDFHTYIEEERFRSLHNLHLLMGKNHEINKEVLKRHVIILVSDGLKTGFSVDIAVNFLKSINYKKLIVATAVSTGEAYDRALQQSNEIYALSIVENYLGADHYFKDNNVPTIEELLDISKNISLLWN